MTTTPPPASDPLQQVLDDTRERFVAAFPAQHDALRALLDEVAERGGEAPMADLASIAHRLHGLAGTIGFPAVGACAMELEAVVAAAATTGFDAPRARQIAAAMAEGFRTDSARLEANGTKILVAEDEAYQLALFSNHLKSAGYVPIGVMSGDQVVDTARAERPAVILLDIALPGLDGYSVCRQLKADPELADIPVIFITTGPTIEDKLAGLTLGADEFLSKPVDMRELVLRIQHLVRRSPAPVLSPPRSTEAASGLGTVVLAEDDPDVTRIVDAQLRAAGYTTIVAFDGQQALDAVREHAPDVLVLDLMMPAVDGFDVLEQLRESAAPRPRVIVLSGRGREEDVVRAFELGVDDYMTKPFNPQELMARVARLFK